MDYKHTDKTGKKWLLSEMTTAHLKNVIKFIEKKAIEGIRVEYGSHDFGDNLYYDYDVLYGESTLKYLGYYNYRNELKKRGEL